jgi:putative spermidine/putrescine transport system substrate-binding protein
MAALAVVAAAAAVGGCGGSDSSSSSSSGGDAAKSGSGPITFVSWGGDYQAAQTKALLDPFTKETGITVKQDGPTDYSKIKAQVAANSTMWDVADVEPYITRGKYCGTLFEKLDYSIIKKDGLEPSLASECSVPAQMWSYVLVYNTDKFASSPPQNWTDFFDTKKYPGKRGVMNWASGAAIEAALLADGVPKDELYPLDLDRAFKKLDTIKKDIAFFDTGAQMQQQMENTEVAMTMGWSGRMYPTIETNKAPYKVVWADNIGTSEQFAIPKGTKNKDAAMKFIAYATQPEPQARLTEQIPYTPGNLTAKPNIDETYASYLAINPAVREKTVRQDPDWWAQNYDEVTKRWMAWTQG